MLFSDGEPSLECLLFVFSSWRTRDAAMRSSTVPVVTTRLPCTVHVGTTQLLYADYTTTGALAVDLHQVTEMCVRASHPDDMRTLEVAAPPGVMVTGVALDLVPFEEQYPARVDHGFLGSDPMLLVLKAPSLKRSGREDIM